jgi:uncharacterized protein (TIGR04222 family)
LEQALVSAAISPADSIQPLTEAGLPVAEDIEEALRKRGLLAASTPSPRQIAASLIMVAPLLLGFAKIAVGLWRDRPVGFLLAACAATAIAALVLLLARSRITAAGWRMVEPLQAQNAHTRQLVEIGSATPSPAQVALLVGLFGAGVLAAGPLARVHAMLPRAAGGGGCSTGGCSTGGCGGGCGGGGCGGGCGGCGS